MSNKFQKWMQNNYDLQTLKDISNHGCVAGFSKLTRYSDTTKLYDKYSEDIWVMLADDAETYKFQNIIALINTFNGAKSVCNSKTFKNLLVWYAAERIAQNLIDDKLLVGDIK